MPEYKSIRLKLDTYEGLCRYQLPRESLSETLTRLIEVITTSETYATWVKSKLISQGQCFMSKSDFIAKLWERVPHERI
jgi:predicted CopG family antitoxin